MGDVIDALQALDLFSLMRWNWTICTNISNRGLLGQSRITYAAVDRQTNKPSQDPF